MTGALTQTTMTDKEKIAALERQVSSLQDQVSFFKGESSRNLKRALLAEYILENLNHSFKKVTIEKV